jgi:hypothetical protein
MATKGIKVFANGAFSGALEESGPIALRASVYKPERVILAYRGMVRDTGFEYVVFTEKN